MTGTIASDEGCASMLAESGIIHDLIELLKGIYIFTVEYGWFENVRTFFKAKLLFGRKKFSEKLEFSVNFFSVYGYYWFIHLDFVSPNPGAKIKYKSSYPFLYFECNNFQ